jgi:hypothetical protein
MQAHDAAARSPGTVADSTERRMQESDCRAHPIKETWRRLLNDELESAEAARSLQNHLETCSTCEELVSRLPPPTLYVLGRPLTPSLPVSPMAMKQKAEQLVDLCMKRMAQGGAVRVSADWVSEPYLYQVLSLCSSELRRRTGERPEVRGQVWNRRKAPTVPANRVAILLQAPVFRVLYGWEQPPEGTVTILAGLDGDWRRRGVAVDLVLEADDPERTVEFFYRDQMERIIRAFEEGSPATQCGLLAVALGADVPASHFGHAMPRDIFMPLKHGRNRQPWFNVEGAWLVWHAASRVLGSRALADLIPSVEREFPELRRSARWEELKPGCRDGRDSSSKTRKRTRKRA